MGIICYKMSQMNEPIETAELLAFTKIVDAKSLSRAAAELSSPRATISRRLSRLEQRLGVQLIRRTTRSLMLTDAGEAFYRQARHALDAVAQAEQSVRKKDDVARGPLRISTPPMADPSFNVMLGEFAAEHPEVHMQVFASTKYVDLSRDGYDVAIRASTKLEPGLVARTIHRSQMLAVAAPSYLAKHGQPRTVRALRGHRCMLGFARGELPETHWPLLSGGRLKVDGNLVSNDLLILRDAARDGLGIAVLPAQVVVELLRQKQLVHVLEGVVGAEVRISVVYAEREFMPAQVRAFIDAVVAWAKSGVSPVMVDLCEAEKGKKTQGNRRGAPIAPVRSVRPRTTK
jgi:DNA-binding transcriptional LysR family regulator